MPAAPILRDYQHKAIADVRAAYGLCRRVVLVSPTGSGKTVTFAELAARVIRRGRRVVLMAHRIEIVEQIGAALALVGVQHGWIAPGHPFHPQQVMVAMVQSLAHRLDKLERPDFLIVDEAHHATAGTYQKIMRAWPGIFILGVTASPARTDGSGLGACFDRLVLGPSMRELIARGYLARFRCFCPPQIVDLSTLKTRHGDFAAEQVDALMNQAVITGDAIKHYQRFLDGKPAIAFCASVAHAEAVAKQFRETGWKAASVDGRMDLYERKDVIQSIGDGRLNVLTSCDVISEGTDIPAVAGALLLRPTQSLIVHLQQIGRVLRPKPDGSPAIILDHVGNVTRLGMPDADREWRLESRVTRPTAPPVRTCPECYATFAIAPKCPECGYVFEQERERRRKSGYRDDDLVEMPATPEPAAEEVDPRTRYLRETSLRFLLKTAHSYEQLAEIAKARGYKPGWIMQTLKMKRFFSHRGAA